MSRAATWSTRRRSKPRRAPRATLPEEAPPDPALASGQLAGCAIDVGRAPDQMPTPRLAARPDVIATPPTARRSGAAFAHHARATVARARGAGGREREGARADGRGQRRTLEEEAMKTVLITGAAGDVGSHLRRERAGEDALRLSAQR